MHGGSRTCFAFVAVGPDRATRSIADDRAASRHRQSFDGGQRRSSGMLALVDLAAPSSCSSLLARRARKLNIRKIAGLEAVEEAVGRATEMGRPCLFVPGMQDMNDIQTIAGLSMLSRVAKRWPSTTRAGSVRPADRWS